MVNLFLRIIIFQTTEVIRREMMRDGNVFPDPDAFKPERYLSKDSCETSECRMKPVSMEDDPSTIVFGFGRRLVSQPFQLQAITDQCTKDSAQANTSPTQTCGSQLRIYWPYLILGRMLTRKLVESRAKTLSLKVKR